MQLSKDAPQVNESRRLPPPLSLGGPGLRVKAAFPRGEPSWAGSRPPKAPSWFPDQGIEGPPLESEPEADLALGVSIAFPVTSMLPH